MSDFDQHLKDLCRDSIFDVDSHEYMAQQATQQGMGFVGIKDGKITIWNVSFQGVAMGYFGPVEVADGHWVLHFKEEGR